MYTGNVNMYVDNHSCICTLVAHVGANSVPPKKKAAKNVNHYSKQNTLTIECVRFCL
jgi:hypothetical protein